jgi:hypothetical protein
VPRETHRNEFGAIKWPRPHYQVGRRPGYEALLQNEVLNPLFCNTYLL